MGNISYSRTSTDIVRMARIVAASGTEGLIKVQSYAVDDSIYEQASGWHLLTRRERSWQPATIESADAKGGGRLIIKLKGCDTREDAAELNDAMIGLERAALPQLPAGRYYWHDLIGTSVSNIQGEFIGTVNAILTTKANPLLEIVNDGRKTLAPLTDQHIIEFDSAAKSVVIDWAFEQ